MELVCSVGEDEIKVPVKSIELRPDGHLIVTTPEGNTQDVAEFTPNLGFVLSNKALWEDLDNQVASSLCLQRRRTQIRKMVYS